MTPEEALAAVRSASEARNIESQDMWEMARIHAAITVQPHVKGKVKPKSLLPLPWDSKRKDIKKAPKTSVEEAKRRFKELTKGIERP